MGFLIVESESEIFAILLLYVFHNIRSAAFNTPCLINVVGFLYSRISQIFWATDPYLRFFFFHGPQFYHINFLPNQRAIFVLKTWCSLKKINKKVIASLEISPKFYTFHSKIEVLYKNKSHRLKSVSDFTLFALKFRCSQKKKSLQL